MAVRLLDGIRVIDLTMVFAGPTCSKTLADLGAEVIKIESGPRSDVFTRGNSYAENDPGGEPWNRGGFFHTMNAGKLGVSLNLGTDKGKDLFRRLVAISDIVIENFSPRVMDNWGLGYDELKKIKPDIIMVSMSGLGHYGPMKDFYMYVPGMEAMSGMSYMTRQPEGPPLISGHAYGDWLLGATGAASTLIALYQRKVTGKGQYIDVSGREAAVCHLGEIMVDCTLNGREPKPVGNQHPSQAPHGCYRCKGEDSWINIAVENDEQWEGFCKALGSPEWCNDTRFANALGRWQNRQELDNLVEQWTIRHERYEAMETLQKARVPAGTVLTIRHLLLDPHLVERDYFDIVDHGENIGKRPLAKQAPGKFSGVETFTPRRAPRFAEDDELVFGKLLGISKEELKQLEDEKVIGGVPIFPPGRPTRTDLLIKQQAGFFDPDYLEHMRSRYGQDIGREDKDAGQTPSNK